ncbi:MAG: hypothetical protein Q8M07_17910 [Prosthecobacter sp.]|nr:hypothetical protein [Prosthecobacter sp.]
MTWPVIMPLAPDITPDLAKRGLEAGARNTLTNVAHGDTLPESKRQLLLSALISEAKPEEVVQARIHAILLRYTEGKRLTKDELAEIAHLLPQQHAPYSKTLTEGNHRRPYKEYETIYGKKERTIKWWVTQGKTAAGGADLPPLDQPTEMPVWWDRVMKQRCPQSVLDAARAASSSPTAAPASKTATAPASPPGGMPRFEAPAVTTQEQNLQHLKEQLARVRHELLEAQNENPPDQSRIEAKERKWRELRSEVDKAEEAVFKMRSKQGKLIDIEQLGSELLPMLVTVANSIRSVRTRIKPRLASARSDEEEEKLWQEGIDECFAELIAGGFISREQLALAA